MKLPKELYVAEALADTDLDNVFEVVNNYLSDKYGYLVKSYNLEIKATDIEWEKE